VRLRKGKKKADTVAGAPFPPVEKHSDGPADRPRHDVPTADTTAEAPPAETEPDDEGDDT
jgi:hypothetical protein